MFRVTSVGFGVSVRLKTADFDFHLPESAIALRPAHPRDSARLMVVRGAHAPFEDRTVRDLPDLLRPGDALVMNDTRVLPVQLFGKVGEARIGVTLIERVDAYTWWAFVKNARRLQPGDHVAFGPNLEGAVEAKREDGAVRWRFACDGPLEAALMESGAMPLPPYIAARRPADAADKADYQTVYAAHDGSVAAPTAGLHFTPELLARLDACGVTRETVTLHVGPGTFLPVKADKIADHVMHAEWGEVSAGVAARLNAVRARGGRVIAVGTTALRLLESAADEHGRLHPFAAETAIFITPGYRFRAVDGLMTNFHLPKSTLFMLVSALMGLPCMKSAYAHAVQSGYRYYSYGDASLLLPEEPS